MECSSTRGWRVFAAHLTDFGILSYIAGFTAGVSGCAGTIGKVLTFVSGWLASVLISSVWVAWTGITLSEWLWGCKFRTDESTKSRFCSYLLDRICMKNSAFENYKNSTTKTVVGCVVLLVVIGVYFL